MVAALLCGLFYGAFFLSVVRKAEEQRRMAESMERWAALWEVLEADEECDCPECFWCEGTSLEDTGTGVEMDDRSTYWSDGHIEA